MHPLRRSIKWLLVLGVLLPGLAAAAQLRASAARILSGDAMASGISLQLDWPARAEAGELRVTVDEVRPTSSAHAFSKVVLVCSLSRHGGAWRCAGHIDARGMKRGELLLTWDADAAGAELSRGVASLRLASPRPGVSGTLIKATRVPLDWLQPLLSAAWTEARFTAGTLDASMVYSADPAAIGGTLQVRTLGLDTDHGGIAADGLNAAGRLSVRFAPRTELVVDLNLSGGELLAGSIYMELPSSPIQLALGASAQPNGSWRVADLRWRDPGVMELTASGDLVAVDTGWQPSGQLAVRSDQLDVLVDRYGRSWLSGLGLPALAATGGMALEIAASAGQLGTAQLHLQDVGLTSGDERLQMEGVRGDVGWTRDGFEQITELSWEAAQVYSLPLGPARVAARSRAGEWRLAAPVRVALMGGSVELQQFRWTPQLQPDSTDVELQLALLLEGIDMAQLSSQLGWPRFEGRLSGRLPQASYADGTLTLDGGLQVDLLDGQVTVDSLQLERPFGIAPTLSASVALRGLDLRPLTAAFGFGEISGRLDGEIRGLRLVDWEPVAFDAHFASVKRAGVPQRISQRAVNDLSRVGGGLAGGLQGTAMRLFDTFGYNRIGIGCRLVNTVCTMRGIDNGAAPAASGSSAAGYTVVEGSGLPRITVNGFQRQVDWPVLVARLKAVTEGQAPRIE